MFLQFHSSYCCAIFNYFLQEDGTETIVISFPPSSRSALKDATSDEPAVITGSDVEPDSSQCTSHVPMDHVEAMPVEHSGCDTKKISGIEFCFSPGEGVKLSSIPLLEVG